MDSDSCPQIKPIYMEDPAVVLHPPARRNTTLGQRLHNWYWNWKRRPEVRRKQKELLVIAEQMKLDIKLQLLPQLWQLRLVCSTCRDNFGFLRAEVFVSSIKLILERMQCSQHGDIYDNFLMSHAPDFERNDNIAAWINGFKN